MNLFILVFISIGAAIGSLFYIKSTLMSLFKGGINNMLTGELPMIGGGSDGKSKVEFLKNKPKAQDPAAANQAGAGALQPAYMSGQPGENLNYNSSNIHTNGMPEVNDASDEENSDNSSEENQENTRKIKGYINQTGQFYQQIKGNTIDLKQSDAQIVNILSNEKDFQEPIPINGDLFGDSNEEIDQNTEFTLGEGGSNLESLRNIVRGSQGENLSLNSLAPKILSGKHYTGPALPMLRDSENGDLGIREIINLYAITKALSSVQDDLVEDGAANYNRIVEKPGFSKMMRSIVTLNPTASPLEIASILLLASKLDGEDKRGRTSGRSLNNMPNSSKPLQLTGGGTLNSTSSTSIGEAGPKPLQVVSGRTSTATSNSSGGLTEEEAREKAIEVTATEGGGDIDTSTEEAKLNEVEIKVTDKKDGNSGKVKVNISDEDLEKISQKIEKSKKANKRRNRQIAAAKKLTETENNNQNDSSPVSSQTEQTEQKGEKATGNTRTLSAEEIKKRKDNK